MYLEDESMRLLVAGWVVIQTTTIIILVWGNKKFLQYSLLANVAASCCILGLYITTLLVPDKEAVGQLVYYFNSVDGMQRANMGYTLYDKFHDAAVFLSKGLSCGMLIVHGIYLANLVQRQELEKKRFSNGRT